MNFKKLLKPTSSNLIAFTIVFIITQAISYLQILIYKNDIMGFPLVFYTRNGTQLSHLTSIGFFSPLNLIINMLFWYVLTVLAVDEIEKMMMPEQKAKK